MVITVEEHPRSNTIVESGSNAGGWIAAVIILLIVIAGGIYAWRHYRGIPAPRASDTNINVTVPVGSGGGSATQ